MRTLTILLFLVAATWMACQKEDSFHGRKSLNPTRRIMIKDDFGLRPDQFSYTKREPLSEVARRFPKKDHPPHPKGGGGGTDTTGGGGGGDTTGGGGGGTPPPPPPSSGAVIYLDFDGQAVSNTYWNTSGTIYAQPANLSGAEAQAILDSVRHDYRNFPITVTADSTVYWAAPSNKRTRVIITESYEWFGAAGGVAYVGSFSWGDGTPCFVFSSLLGYSVKNIFEATSHEAGHTLGLYHQSEYDASGTKTAEYRNGVIMGVGYYVANADWIIGLNSYGQVQNDTLIIGQTIRQ